MSGERLSAAAMPEPTGRARVFHLMAPASAVERLGAVAQLAATIATGDDPPCLVIWRATPALVVTATEARLDGFDRASAELRESGWPVVVRKSGGGLFPVGPGTLQVALVGRREHGMSFDRVYERLAGLILDALASLGLGAEVGEVTAAFCPGRYDIAVSCRKLAGLSQSWPADGAVIAEASLLVDADPCGLAAAVNRFHDAAGSCGRCDPAAVTSLAVELTAPRNPREFLPDIVSGALCTAYSNSIYGHDWPGFLAARSSKVSCRA